MRRQSNRLTQATIKAGLRRAPAAGKLMLNDGHGLYLQINNRVPSWLYRYALAGHTGAMGLGPLDQVSLALARELAEDARRLKRRGIDPLRHKREGTQAGLVATAQASPRFAECAKQYIAAHRAEWRSAKHAAQWPATLEAYVFPVFGHFPVDAIDTGLVMRALEPVWQAHPVTADRVRSRIANVLDWARAAGYRDGDNPARWKGHLENLLPAPGKVHTKQHHAALPHTEIGAFMVKLRARSEIAARALDFLILTAARTGEVLGARWDETDLTGRMWTISAARMKAKKLHRVPLSAPAMAIVEYMAKRRTGEMVFPGTQADRPLTGTALRRQLAALGHDALTVHGFRSCFRGWVAECTDFPAEVAEMALAHRVGTAVERAYQRSDMFEKRRQLAEAWADYCDRPTGQVVAFAAVRQ